MNENINNFEACEISPIGNKVKHQSTPRRFRSKTHRGENGIDVHTTGSTSGNQSPRVFNSSMNSPSSSSFPHSQDTGPDVVWDYNSPKLPKSKRKKEIKLTIQELLENLNQCQDSECDKQSGQYVQLLESWMTNQAAGVKKTKKIKKGKKKEHGPAIEKLKEFLNTIPRFRKDASLGGNKMEECKVNKSGQISNTNLLNGNTSCQPLTDEECSEGDSMEELWGDVDNSFMVKATQDLESFNPAHANLASEGPSTIPETVPSKIEKNTHPHVCSNWVSLDAEILEHLTSIDWESDEWEEGFLEEDDILSSIPDAVLTGEDTGGNVHQQSSITCSSKNLNLIVESAGSSGRKPKPGITKNELESNVVTEKNKIYSPGRNVMPKNMCNVSSHTRQQSQSYKNGHYSKTNLMAGKQCQKDADRNYSGRTKGGPSKQKLDGTNLQRVSDKSSIQTRSNISPRNVYNAKGVNKITNNCDIKNYQIKVGLKKESSVKVAGQQQSSKSNNKRENIVTIRPGCSTEQNLKLNGKKPFNFKAGSNITKNDKISAASSTFTGMAQQNCVVQSKCNSNLELKEKPQSSSCKESSAILSDKLSNSFSDDDFEDEFLLNQPEVLSRIDEVENQMSQLPKCTPEEIEKKKKEAIKRRTLKSNPK